jgi:AcrR family transcriptional regulator
MSVHNGTHGASVRIRRPLLDVVAEVLLADPSASLTDVAAAAGIGRTTLHKHYATRADLVSAVGHRAIDLWEEAVDGVEQTGGGLRDLTDALIPIGSQLTFLWRSPELDHVSDINERWAAVERRGLAVLEKGRSSGGVRDDVPDWWLLQTFYSLVYVAAESIRSGRLAPRDATDMVLSTLLNGVSKR